MNINEFYKYQAIARGMKSFSDFQSHAHTKARVYDRLILKWLPKSMNAHIYEAACGSGIFLLWLRKLGYVNIFGSDSSEVQIQIAKYANLPVTCADSISELASMSDQSMDCIVAMDFYEHLPKEKMLDFFSTAFRVLRQGGVLLLHGPNGDSPVIGRSLFNDITHHWALTSVAFRATLQMLGFDKIVFVDDAIASIERYRPVKVPIALISYWLIRYVIRSATREDIECLSASFFVIARK